MQSSKFLSPLFDVTDRIPPWWAAPRTATSKNWINQWKADMPLHYVSFDPQGVIFLLSLASEVSVAKASVAVNLTSRRSISFKILTSRMSRRDWTSKINLLNAKWHSYKIIFPFLCCHPSSVYLTFIYIYISSTIFTMSTLNNVESVSHQQGSFKPSVAREGPITDKGVSSQSNAHRGLKCNKLNII